MLSLLWRFIFLFYQIISPSFHLKPWLMPINSLVIDSILSNFGINSMTVWFTFVFEFITHKCLKLWERNYYAKKKKIWERCKKLQLTNPSQSPFIPVYFSYSILFKAHTCFPSRQEVFTQGHVETECIFPTSLSRPSIDVTRKICTNKQQNNKTVHTKWK